MNAVHKWLLGIVGTVCGGLCITAILAGIAMRGELIEQRTSQSAFQESVKFQLDAMKSSFSTSIGEMSGDIQELQAELKGRPRYDLNQAIEEKRSQTARDTSQDQRINDLAKTTEKFADNVQALRVELAAYLSARPADVLAAVRSLENELHGINDRLEVLEKQR